MSKKLISTVFLFAVFAGFLWWGVATLLHPQESDSIVYGLLLLGCSGYALVSLLMLPWKKER